MYNMHYTYRIFALYALHNSLHKLIFCVLKFYIFDVGASLNPVDYKYRSGGPRPLLKIKTPVVWGFDFSGIVEAQKVSSLQLFSSGFDCHIGHAI